MEFLKLRDVRDVPRSCQNPAKALALRDFLRGLTVVIVSRSTWPNSFERTGENRTVRKKIIREVVLDAGEVSFPLNGSMTTVQVCFSFVYDDEVLNDHCRSIGAIIITMTYAFQKCLESNPEMMLCSPLKIVGSCRDSDTKGNSPRRTPRNS